MRKLFELICCAVLLIAAFGAASEVEPKFTSHSDPASQWTAARKGAPERVNDFETVAFGI
ncbi:MAG: hypothetical protein ACI92Z_001363 [Paracoccaceae bacterium]|jgi:hypothetical protein